MRETQHFITAYSVKLPAVVNSERHHCNLTGILYLPTYLSVKPGIDRCHLANGDIICGWFIIKVGLMHFSSR